MCHIVTYIYIWKIFLFILLYLALSKNSLLSLLAGYLKDFHYFLSRSTQEKLPSAHCSYIQDIYRISTSN